ncbi:MAG: NosD domain-containing protein [Candidatus Bathyarchaeia archaeon]
MAWKKVRLLFILITLIFGFLYVFPIESLLPAAKATYVEGPIELDTVWTLVDSPFVLSRNVTVSADVTLMIEPGVEVKFGGPFSLIVNGALVAIGTEDKPVKFTSNKEMPKAGDWQTILVNGSSLKSSLLTNCLVEYATNGITLERGTLIVQNSIVRSNSEDGILVYDGYAIVEHNILQTNGKAGIEISGGGAIVQNNFLTSNGDGVILTGGLSSQVAIKQNMINFNKNSGVMLKMNVSTIVSVEENTVTSNKYGFYVSTSIGTFITRNYVLNNSVGAFYEQGEGHVAVYNDICGNKLGMDVSSNATVDATKNYWGDPSGPHHVSLNPRGKGNPVGGNGVNLDFIFFLTTPIDHVAENSPPTAILWTDKTLVAPGQEVSFVSAYSYDDGRVNQYLYDFGDGYKTNWTTLSLFIHAYNAAGEYSASLKVMDDCGNISDTVSTFIRVVEGLQPLNVKLTLGSYVVGPEEEVPVTVHVSLSGSPVGSANVVLLSVKGGSFSRESGLTDSSGYFTTTFKAPDVEEVTEIRLIAKASMEGFADGSGYEYLRVLPPLTVNVAAEPKVVTSEGSSTITAVVSWNGIPVSEATVALTSSSGGTFTETQKITNSTGKVAFTFNAPPVSKETNITITAAASKPGYPSAVGLATLTLKPATMAVNVVPSSYSAKPEEMLNITVYVKCNGKPLKDVSVTVTADAGTFAATSASTDAEGRCEFSLLTPKTAEVTSVNVTVNAAKNGYVSSSESVSLTVIPEAAGGIPITTLLLVLIPVLLAAALIVLVKVGVISISAGGEEWRD